MSYHLEDDCLQIDEKIIPNQFPRVNLYLRFLNQSSKNDQLLGALFHRMVEQLDLAKCLPLGRTNVAFWKKNAEQNDSILFDQEEGLNIIVDIHQFTSELLSYDIVVQMPTDNDFIEKLTRKIDFSFLLKLQHPAEQAIAFKLIPPFLNIKIFVDSIMTRIVLGRSESIVISWTFSRISCTPYRRHETIPTRWSFLFMTFSLSITYLFYSFIIIHFILQEKLLKIKEIIKIIHIQPLINYLAWALRPLFILSILSVTLTGELNISNTMQF